MTEPDTAEAEVQCSLGEVLLVKPVSAPGAEGELQLVEAASLQQPLHLMQHGDGNMQRAYCMLTEFNTQASATQGVVTCLARGQRCKVRSMEAESGS